MVMLFTDGSVNAKLKLGYGAFLSVNEDQCLPLLSEPKIRLKQFEDTSSTKLELQVLLWALAEVDAEKITVYTDSQNIIGLIGRRSRLEGNDYYSKNGKQIKNHVLYREFYKLLDIKNVILKQVKGHQVSQKKTPEDEVFSLVDRASRRALRQYVANL